MSRVKRHTRTVRTTPPESLETWINDVDPAPLAEALRRRDPDLLAYAKYTQESLRREGYQDSIVLLRAVAPGNHHWQGHEFSSWTSSPVVAHEFAEKLARDGEYGDIVRMRIPITHILAAGGYGGLDDFGYALMDYEFVVMHNIPQKLSWKGLRVQESGEWL